MKERNKLYINVMSQKYSACQSIMESWPRSNPGQTISAKAAVSFHVSYYQCRTEGGVHGSGEVEMRKVCEWEYVWRVQVLSVIGVWHTRWEVRYNREGSNSGRKWIFLVCLFLILHNVWVIPLGKSGRRREWKTGSISVEVCLHVYMLHRPCYFILSLSWNIYFQV